MMMLTTAILFVQSDPGKVHDSLHFLSSALWDLLFVGFCIGFNILKEYYGYGNNDNTDTSNTFWWVLFSGLIFEQKLKEIWGNL